MFVVAIKRGPFVWFLLAFTLYFQQPWPLQDGFKDLQDMTLLSSKTDS